MFAVVEVSTRVPSMIFGINGESVMKIPRRTARILNPTWISFSLSRQDFFVLFRGSSSSAVIKFSTLMLVMLVVTLPFLVFDFFILDLCNTKMPQRF